MKKKTKVNHGENDYKLKLDSLIEEKEIERQFRS